MYRLISFAVLLLALHCVLAMPDHPASMRMSGELSHEVDLHNDTTATDNATTATTSSAEDDDDDNADDDANEDEDDDDDEIHVEGKSSSCPPRQPEVVEIERQCMTEYKAMEKGGPCMQPLTKEKFVIEHDAPNAATIRLETVPDLSSEEDATESPRRKHRPHMSFYYHCLMRKLDWLDADDGPSKPKIQAWVAANVTDVTQREQTQKQLDRCLIKTGFETVTESSTESTEETEQSTETSSKKRDQLRCDTSRALVCCLHHVECPLVKYP